MPVVEAIRWRPFRPSWTRVGDISGFCEYENLLFLIRQQQNTILLLNQVTVKHEYFESKPIKSGWKSEFLNGFKLEFWLHLSVAVCMKNTSPKP